MEKRWYDLAKVKGLPQDKLEKRLKAKQAGKFMRYLLHPLKLGYYLKLLPWKRKYFLTWLWLKISRVPGDVNIIAFCMIQFWKSRDLWSSEIQKYQFLLGPVLFQLRQYEHRWGVCWKTDLCNTRPPRMIFVITTCFAMVKIIIWFVPVGRWA